MAGNDLIIDDEYVDAIGKYFESQGKSMESILKGYIACLERLSSKGITSGQTSAALKSYIAAARVLSGKIEEISSTAKKQAQSFIAEIDNADKYLY